jgi:NADH-quinone oxidoreductase subunit H
MLVTLAYIQILLTNIFIFLFLTLIIATITLMERKILSLVQRRVGPNYIGYKGRLQFIADALKLLVKHIMIINRVNKFLFLILPASILIICYLFWVNLLWLPNLSICEIEYNLLFTGVFSMFFSFLIFLVGWVTKNKYSIISSTRVLVTTLNLEVFINFFFIYLILFFESFSFFQIVSFQFSWTWSLFLLLPILPLLFIIFFLETGRIPFDLGEAESELIAGHTTEMGGFFFALFYLGEYFHLFCFSLTYILILFGGWHF